MVDSSVLPVIRVDQMIVERHSKMDEVGLRNSWRPMCVAHMKGYVQESE